MADDSTPVVLRLRGVSGTTYEYHRKEKNTMWMGVAGNYLFARAEGDAYVLLFAGQTDDLAQHMASGATLLTEAVETHQASHVFSHIGQKDLDARVREQRDLVAAYRPPLNVRYPDR